MILLKYIGIAIAALSLSLVACSDKDADAKKLGFDNAKEMADIRAAGYSTKPKYLEMSKLAEARKARPPSQSIESSKAAAEPTAAAPKADATTPPPQVATEQTKTPSASAAPVGSSSQPPTTQSDPPQSAAQAIDVAKCTDMIACVELMLTAAKSENLSGAMDVARKIDSSPKAARGDRKTARQLNQNGLDALRQKNMPEAILLLSKARTADPADEEIIGNLVVAYVEDNNYAKATAMALDGLSLNPKRANLWLPFAVAQQKQGKTKDGLAALWLAWQFSTDKEKMLTLLDSRIADEKDDAMKAFYVSGKAWVKDNKKPTL